MRSFVSALVVVLGFATYGLAQNKTIYTSTKTGACKTVKSSSEGTGSYIGECPGVGGYKLRLIEGDIRQTIDIITPTRKKFELNFWNFYGSFSSIGDKIEWRTNKGVPVAMIARYNVADPEGVKPTTSYLMISKIAKTGSCVTDVVPPMAKQNEEARRLADIAPTKPCKTVNG